MPAFPLTVPETVYMALAKVAGEPFADSYLWGAKVTADRVLHFRTLTAWEAVQNTYAAKNALRELRLDMPRPTPFPGDGDRMTAAKELGWEPPAKRGRKRERPDY